MQTLSQYLVAYETQFPEQTGIQAAIEDLAEACSRIADLVQRGSLNAIHGEAGETNVQGEAQQKLDILSNQILLDVLAWSGNWAGLASEEMEHCYPIPDRAARGNFLCLFDPLDGSGNIDVNLSIGSIFSVLAHPRAPQVPTETDFLQSGRNQIAAGYVLYGAATTMVLTLGQGVVELTWDTSLGEFCISQQSLKIPADANMVAINMSNYAHWQTPVKTYIDQCLAGQSGVYGKKYNMRWMGCMVADMQRILHKGGVFLYPTDSQNSAKPAKLRLMYEANPMAFLVEQAGGESITGMTQILDVQPQGLHDRVAVISGSQNEVHKLQHLHQDN